MLTLLESQNAASRLLGKRRIQVPNEELDQAACREVESIEVVVPLDGEISNIVLHEELQFLGLFTQRLLGDDVTYIGP